MAGWWSRSLGRLWFWGLRLAGWILPRRRALRTARGTLPGQPFLAGVNLPWLSYGNDFGRSPWRPGGGVAGGADRVRLAEVLAGLAARGGGCVRWFLFADGRAGIRTDDAGCPLGLDDRVFPDLDLAVETAGRHGLKLLLVVFDFHLGLEARRHREVTMGGRRRWIADPAWRAALLERVLDPLWERYGQEPVIFGWDLMNEPEWITSGLGGRDPQTAVPPWTMRRFLAEMAGRARRWTDQRLTVGLATPRALPLVRGLDLDFFQVHWYDRSERRCPLDRPVGRLGLDRPLLLGEYPTRNSARSEDEIVTLARRNGYAGALAWSLLGTDPASRPAAAEDGPPPA